MLKPIGFLSDYLPLALAIGTTLLSLGLLPIRRLGQIDLRVSASKQTCWEELGVSQCLNLTLADMEKDEPMISAAAYFWSNTLNAFLLAKDQ